jgi:hypothetical protein
VEAFSFLMLTAYLAFVVPEQREREFVYDPQSPVARRLGAVVRALDWFRRFRRTERHADGPTLARYHAVARDGRVERGWRSWVLLARGLPLLFPFWAPLALLSLLRPAAKSLAADATSNT